MALTYTGSYDDINKALSFRDTVYQDMLNRYLRELIEPLPSDGRVVVIIQIDLLNLIQFTLVEVSQRSIQLINIGILAVYSDDRS